MQIKKTKKKTRLKNEKFKNKKNTNIVVIFLPFYYTALVLKECVKGFKSS